PTGGCRGAQRHLRGGLSRLLLRVPTGTQAPRCARCAGGRDLPEEGELDTRCGHRRLLLHARSGVADEVSRASDSGQADSALDPSVVGSRSYRGWELVGDTRRNTAGRIGFAVARQRVPALCLGSVGPAVETSQRTW